jgi:hypothetical protein
VGDTELGALMAEPLEAPVLQWPFQMSGFNQSEIAMVEQDSSEEIAECVAMVFSVEEGSLVDAPELGLPDPSFKAGGVSEDTLVAIAQRWEPRATLAFSSDTLVQLAQVVNVEVAG